MENDSARIRIVIADDHTMFRDGLRSLLEAETDLEVVGEAADGEQAVQLTRRLQPDILLLDLNMPRWNGLDALRELDVSSGTVRPILLAAVIEKDQIARALQLGARGVVLKESATEVLLKSIRMVMAGQYWVGRDSVTDLVSLLRDLMTSSHRQARPKKFGLTPRELQIVSAVVSGFSNKEIAQKFFLSEDTVKHHITNIFNKMGVSNRLEMAVAALHHKLVAGE
ncbi:MAG: DNA-binding response regulator [Acidobacteria bacterium RIFCSPLOWO2_02_FULL_59_13]|nr:MAG: DNA-binding response regulator [Acidobacteria bacterium RIFCSPLOWO2_02_FULL_59_13]